MTTTIIGTGLIGGSLALTLKARGISHRILGVDNNPLHLQRALERNIIDEIASLDEALPVSDIVVLAIPVDRATVLLPDLLEKVSHQLILDVGSTKADICAAVHTHPQRSRYVASHPMWGTEFSGPDAAIEDPFQHKTVVICNREHSAPDALRLAEDIYNRMNMRIIYMDAIAHDIHAAYVSHISHITSFALANTVLEKEREEDAIFDLASGGFESTVRLAKSNPAMWIPIFQQNRDNVLDVLNEHISQLRKFKSCIEKENWEYLGELIEHANKIKKILK